MTQNDMSGGCTHLKTVMVGDKINNMGSAVKMSYNSMVNTVKDVLELTTESEQMIERFSNSCQVDDKELVLYRIKKMRKDNDGADLVIDHLFLIPADMLPDFKEDRAYLLVSYTKNNVEDFKSGMLQAILFTECDDEQVPLDDNYGVCDFTQRALEVVENAARTFLTRVPYIPHAQMVNAGIDYIFTRNGGGVSFADYFSGDMLQKMNAAIESDDSVITTYVTGDGEIELEVI